MIKKNILLTVAILLLSLAAFGQRKKDIKYAGFLFYDSYYFNGPLTFHLGGGVPFYSGDVCSGLGCNDINPGFLLGASYKFAPGTFAAIDFQYLQMGASSITNSRTLSFTGNNLELTAYVRYNFIKDVILKHYHMDQKPRFIKPFMKLGIGVLKYNPSYVYETSNNNLNPDITYSTGGYALIIPVGLGLSFNFSNKTSVLFDANYRYCFNDYIDGISTGTGNNDGYLTVNLTLTYSPWAKRLKPKKRTAPEGTSVPTSGGGASPSPSSGGGASPAPGAGGGEKDDQIVPEDTTPTPEEEVPYEGYEEEPAEDESSDGEYYDFEEESEEEGAGEEGGGEEYYDDSGW